MHNFFLHKNILIFRRFFNSANRFFLLILFSVFKKKIQLYHKIPCFSLFAITLFPIRYTFLISLFIRFQKKDVLLPLNS